MAQEAPTWVLPIVEQAVEGKDVPIELLLALLRQESGFNPKAESHAGAQGIAQFMPGTAQQYGIDPWDPYQAIPAAAQYLQNSYGLFNDWAKALASYNAGVGAVQKYGGIPPFPETQNYVKSIMGSYNPSPTPTSTPVAQQYQAPRPAPTPAPSGGRTYTVKPGDTLSKIAQQYLGNASAYPKLSGYRSGDPNLIYPGEVINIPNA